MILKDCNQVFVRHSRGCSVRVSSEGNWTRVVMTCQWSSVRRKQYTECSQLEGSDRVAMGTHGNSLTILLSCSVGLQLL